MAKYELWINLYPGYGYNVYPSKEQADADAESNRIECRKIEWGLPEVKFKKTVYMWSDGSIRLSGEKGPYAEPHEKVIASHVLEWEVPEPTRVADYFVPINKVPSAKMLHNNEDFWYCKMEYPIGQQPEGSVMVPGSERTTDD